MIFASKAPHIRPKCNLRIHVPASFFLSAIQNQLDNKEDVRGRLVNNHVYLQLPEEQQHYWSPELHVTILEEENVTTIKGIAGPNGKVWATFMVFYGLAIMLFIFGGLWGYPNCIWVCPLNGFGVFRPLSYFTYSSLQQQNTGSDWALIS